MLTLLLATFSTQSPLTFEPSICTLRRLCVELKRQGFNVACDPSIGDRAALISIHNRQWDDVHAILSEALGITFRGAVNGELVMSADPDVKSRERAEFEKYMAHVDRRAQQVFERVTSLSRELPPNMHLATQRLTQLAQDKLTKDNVTRGAATYLLGLVSFPRLDPITAYVFVSGGGVRSLINGDLVAYGLGGSNLPDGLPNWARFSAVNQLVEQQYVNFVQRASYNPQNGIIWFSRRLCRTPYEDILLQQFGELNQSVAHFSLANWMEMKDASVDQASLKSQVEPLSNLSKPIKEESSVRSIALLLGDWSKQTSTDIVFELSPVRDSLLFPMRAGVPVRVDEVLWPIPSKDSEIMEKLGPSPSDSFSPFGSIANTVRSVSATQKTKPWQPMSVRGTLVLKNKLSFLDRKYPLPFSYFLAQGLALPTNGEDSLVPSFSSFVKSAAKLSDRQAAQVARCDLSWLPEGAARFLPFARLLGSLPTAEFSNLLNQLSQEGSAEFTPTRHEINALCDALTAQVKTSEDVYNPRADFPAAVLHPEFRAAAYGGRIRLTIAKKASGALALSCDLLVNKPDSAELIALTAATISGIQITK